MTIRNAAIAIAVLSLRAAGAEYTLELKPETTQIHWTLADPLHTVHGTFTLKRGTIEFDPETGKAAGLVVVDAASGESGSEARDRRMLTNVLETSKYSEVTFAPERMEGSLAVPGTSNVKLHGVFTLHGAAHEIAMDVQAVSTADRIRATIVFAVPYVAWGLKDPSNFLLKVDKTVRVSIEASGPLQKR